MKKLFTFLFALIAGIGTICASYTQVNGIYYDFNKTTQTAAVTYHGNTYENNEYTPVVYSGAVIIPSSVSYDGITYSVTSIGDYAFFECSSLTSVTIPNGVTSIGDNTFFDCSSLTSVTIPNSVTSIADEAFYGCSSLTSVTINSDAIVNKDYSIADNLKTIFGSQVTKYIIGPTVKGIGSFAFQGCLGLSSVTIPNSVTSIGDYAFGDCSKLSSVHISDIAAWCQISFGNTSANPLIYAHNLYLNGDIVTDLVIPNSVTSIGDYAFYNCTSLTSVTIPNGVTSIGNRAFIYCSGLSSVTIPSSVTAIGKYAFMACNNLYDVYCYATTPPTADQSSFTNYNAFLHVLCNNQQMYLSDEVFGKFQSIVCLGADDVMTNGVTVAPGKNDVVITWPTEGSANSYTLEIKKDGMVFCTLTFNANGQLTGIAFMPRPDGSTPAKAATSVGAGYQFTVTGLDGASHYTYELTTKDAENQVIASYTGEFSTEGFTALEDAVIPSLRVVDGAVVCDEPYTIYDMSGRDVTNQNGTLQGVYIVRTAKGAVKVVF